MNGRRVRLQIPLSGHFERRDVVAVALILLVLAGITTPFLLRMREAARRLACEDRQIDVAFALLAYSDDFGELPGYCDLLGRDHPPSDARLLSDGKNDAFVSTWVPKMLPYLGKEPDSVFPGRYAPLASTLNRRGLRDTADEIPFLSELICPADVRPYEQDRRRPWTTWVANTGLPDATSATGAPPDWPANGVFLDYVAAPNVRQTLDMIAAADGTQYTLMLTENIDAGMWPTGGEAEVGCVWESVVSKSVISKSVSVLGINENVGQGDGSMRYARPASHHSGGVNAMFCDGSSRFISDQIDPSIFPRMMTSNDAELKQPGADIALEEATPR